MSPLLVLSALLLVAAPDGGVPHAPGTLAWGGLSVRWTEGKADEEARLRILGRAGQALRVVEDTALERVELRELTGAAPQELLVVARSGGGPQPLRTAYVFGQRGGRVENLLVFPAVDLRLEDSAGLDFQATLALAVYDPNEAHTRSRWLTCRFPLEWDGSRFRDPRQRPIDGAGSSAARACELPERMSVELPSHWPPYCTSPQHRLTGGFGLPCEPAARTWEKDPVLSAVAAAARRSSEPAWVRPEVLAGKVPAVAWGGLTVQLSLADAQADGVRIVDATGKTVWSGLRGGTPDTASLVELTGAGPPELLLIEKGEGSGGDGWAMVLGLSPGTPTRVRELLLVPWSNGRLRGVLQGGERPDLIFESTLVRRDQWRVLALRWNGSAFVDVTRGHPQTLEEAARAVRTLLVPSGEPPSLLGGDAVRDLYVHALLAGAGEPPARALALALLDRHNTRFPASEELPSTMASALLELLRRLSGPACFFTGQAAARIGGDFWGAGAPRETPAQCTH
jgi:hypothetical protein